MISFFNETTITYSIILHSLHSNLVSGRSYCSHGTLRCDVDRNVGTMYHASSVFSHTNKYTTFVLNYDSFSAVCLNYRYVVKYMDVVSKNVLSMVAIVTNCKDFHRRQCYRKIFETKKKKPKHTGKAVS